MKRLNHNLVKKLFQFYLFILPFPLFLTTGLALYTGGNSSLGSETYIPISFIVSGFLILIVLFQLKIKKDVIFLISLVISIYTFSFFIGFLINGIYSPLLYISYISPVILGIVLGYNSKSYLHLNDIYKIIITSVSAFSILFIISSLIQFGIIGTFAFRGADNLFGIIGIHNKLTYLPTFIASTIIILYYTNIKIWSKYLIFVPLIITLFILANRESLAVFICGSLITIFYLRNAKIVYLNIGLSILAGLLLLIVMQVDITDFKLVSKINEMLKSGSVDDLTGSRTVMIKRHIGEIIENLVMGTGFSMGGNYSFTPHNQYLEIVLRGGIISLFPTILLIFFILYKSSFSLLSVDKIPIFIILILYLLLSFNLRTPLRVPFSALFIWTLMGCLIPRKEEKIS